jgi:hypothetical protein
MTATQEQLDEYCSTVLQPLAEALMKHSKRMFASPSAFYQACLHHTIFTLKHIMEAEKREGLASTIFILAHIAQQMAEEELEGEQE